VSLQVFPFRLRLPELSSASEGEEPRLLDTTAEDGKRFARSLDPDARFTIPRAEVIATDSDATTSHAAFRAFMRSIAWGADTCLVKAILPAHFIVEDEGSGVSGGGAGDEFTLEKRYIDESALVVKVDGTPVDAADYDFADNNTAPKVTTKAGFPSGAVRFDYEYYYEGYVRARPATALTIGARTLASPGVTIVQISFEERVPGGYLVAA